MEKTIFTIRLLLPFIAFIFFVPYIASSQESTEKLDAMYDSGSIVREVNADSLLVYSNINVCSFSLIKNGDPNVDILKLNNILSVSDFEIDGKTVYLCGEMLGGKTYMGYFELTGFPYSTFNYVELDGIDSVFKLEILHILPVASNERAKLMQVVMTGRYAKKYYTIIDAVPVSSGWDLYYINTFINNESIGKYRYDDIAIIDSSVVITSKIVGERDSAFTKADGHIWYFTKPASLFTPLNLSTVYSKAVPYTVTLPFLIKKCYANIFVTATKGGTGDIFVGNYSHYTLNGTARLSTSQSVLKDLCYNIDDNATDILVDLYNYNNPPTTSAVYTVLPVMTLLPGIAYGHRFDILGNYVYNSLIYRKNKPHRYICTGYMPEEAYSLYIHRYVYGSTAENCSSLTYVPTSAIDKDFERINAKLQYIVGHYDTQIMDPDYKGTPLVLTCGEIDENNH